MTWVSVRSLRVSDCNKINGIFHSSPDDVHVCLRLCLKQCICYDKLVLFAKIYRQHLILEVKISNFAVEVAVDK